MYFAVVKLTFEDQGLASSDLRDFKALAERIRRRFRVTAAVYESEGGSINVALAALAPSEEQLSRTLDKISAFCEEVGVGRVESEEALIDDVDHLGEFYPDLPS